MDLDDQLAALAAGELDDATARALVARAAADPAVARRLARFRRLHEVLEVPLDAPPMAPDAVARLEARLTTALDELGDEPLVPVAAVPSTAVVPDTRADTPSGGATVLDLGAARARRGLPSWAAPALGAAAAAMLVLAVGGPLLTGGDDGDQLAVEATDAGSERIEESAETDVAESGAAVTEDEAAQDDVLEVAPLEEVEAGDESPGVAAEDTGPADGEVLATEEEAAEEERVEEAPAPPDDGGQALADDGLEELVDLGVDVPVVAFDLRPGEELLLVEQVVSGYAFVPAAREAQLQVLAGLGGPAATCAAGVLADAPEDVALLALGLGTWDGGPAVAAVLGAQDLAAPARVVVSTPDCVELARSDEAG